MPHLSEVLQSLRGLFAREALPPPPPPTASAISLRPGLLRWLLAPEPLPLDPPPPRPVAKSVLEKLLAREVLSLDPVPPSAPTRAPWLRWLFAAEPIDPRSPGTEEE